MKINIDKAIIKKIVKESINNVLNLNESETRMTNNLIQKMYKRFGLLFGHLYRDNSWENVYDVKAWLENFDEVEDVIMSSGVYHKYLNGSNDLPYRTYKILINTTFGTKIGGEITCSAAGTMQDPFDRYDMTISLWRK